MTAEFNGACYSAGWRFGELADQQKRALNAQPFQSVR